MRHGIHRAFFLTMLLAVSLNTVHAQGAGLLTDELSDPGLMTDAMPGIGNLLPVEDLLSTEESLSTENAPAPGAIPVDGGLSLLLAAGAAYGVRRVRGKKRAAAERSALTR